MILRTDQKVVCEVQGKLFEMALSKGYDCRQFIELFMNSRIAMDLDLVFNKYQWMGEEYLMEEFCDEATDIPKAGITYSREMMYWCGYIYRYWHYYTDETSAEIYKTANAEMMNMCWPAYHTLDVEFAIDRIRENREINDERR